ncbi:MAG: DUF2194 domain-containing protein [Frisingicoccus sp.]|uniref:DUF2194 domain-containing protein n=1 Tax=Frisingicoccus sp. TaxID=1918627 RepID=UPI002A808297|nr:DUF2194 domain-containing protein [Frisingicoccus sp.]MDY4834306.1 DUF2194 domain-containing protein [Frisingicoccus sp.]
MLSKRNLVMMMTMFIVVLVLFLSSAVLKEFFNDYDVNHSAQTEIIEKKEQQEIQEERGIFFIGTEDNGYFQVMKEWAGYRKKSFSVFTSLDAAYENLQTRKEQMPCLLVDGELIEENVIFAAKKLTEYVEAGGVVIFYRLPSYKTIKGSDTLQQLLGIQHVREESIQLHEIRLYSGFLLGGETCYSFEGVEETELVDMERNIPWYDISSGTKSYMVGFLSEDEKLSRGLNNEDMPAIIWRSNMGTGSVFAVNGDYMKGEAALGLLDAMAYETEDYALYPVVNAQNLSVLGFPDLTVENEKAMIESYGMTTRQLCRDVLWPSLVSAADKNNWKITSFLSVKQSDMSPNEPNRTDLVEYLKYFNEESVETGISLGRMKSLDVAASVEEERKTIQDWDIEYRFAGGYVRKENKDQIESLIDSDGQIKQFHDIRTVVGEYEEDEPIVSWMTDKVTLQNATADAYAHSYKDSLRLKSLETALGYTNVQVDIYRVLWPESEADEWENVAEKMAANIYTYWKPFAAFDKTTISESDRRVRNFLNGSTESTRNGNRISIQTKDFTGDAYLLLRTHGEIPDTLTGGEWKEVERGTYLLRLTSEEAQITLKPEKEAYYKE